MTIVLSAQKQSPALFFCAVLPSICNAFPEDTASPLRVLLLLLDPIQMLCHQ